MRQQGRDYMRKLDPATRRRVRAALEEGRLPDEWPGRPPGSFMVGAYEVWLDGLAIAGTIAMLAMSGYSWVWLMARDSPYHPQVEAPWDER